MGIFSLKMMNFALKMMNRKSEGFSLHVAGGSELQYKWPTVFWVFHWKCRNDGELPVKTDRFVLKMAIYFAIRGMLSGLCAATTGERDDEFRTHFDWTIRRCSIHFHITLWQLRHGTLSKPGFKTIQKASTEACYIAWGRRSGMRVHCRCIKDGWRCTWGWDRLLSFRFRWSINFGLKMLNSCWKMMIPYWQMMIVVVQVPMIEAARQMMGLSYFGVIDEWAAQRTKYKIDECHSLHSQSYARTL